MALIFSPTDGAKEAKISKKKKKNLFRAHMEYESARQPIEKQMTVGNVKRHVRWLRITASFFFFFFWEEEIQFLTGKPTGQIVGRKNA